MFERTVLLFFFATTMVSSQLVPKLSIKPGGCPPAPELAPMICQFMQGNTHLQFKPQLIAPTTYIPPLVVEKCDRSQLQMEINLPLPLDKKPVVIPEPPTLPPIKLPKFPVPVIIEKPILPPVPTVEHCESAVISEMPLVDIPVAPELPPRELPAFPQIVEQLEVKEPEKDFKPMLIPQPPALHGFVMSELPVRVPEPLMVIEPCPEDQSIQVIPVPYVQSLAHIPTAPELPPARLPELPVSVERPTQPIFPPMIVETSVDETYVTGEIAAIPTTPELPPARLPEFSVLVETPVSPIIVERPSVEESFIADEIMLTQPLAPIPAAPELPPTRLPQLPVQVEIPTQPILPPMIIERPAEEPCIEEIILPQPKPVLIPQPHEGPQFIIPEPVKMEVMKPMPMPIFPSYPEAGIMTEPCEPFVPLMNMAQFPSYFKHLKHYLKHLPSGVAIRSEKLKEYVVPYVRRV